jgi:phosphoglycolate phosphatase-like HAD superfamily hydrolase
MRHIVWDWNGTLFDDQHLVLEGLGAVLDAAGLPRVDLVTYQRLYTRPVQVFYERLFGRTIGPDEWEWLDELYHRGYREALAHAALVADAEVALRRAAAAGRTQSLLSMWRHDELVPLVDRLDIAAHFVRVDGLRGAAGGHKAPHLAAHLERLPGGLGRDPAAVVVVGDALDDAAAAVEIGTACVLYDGGSHPRAELEAAGVPVADRLTDALDLVGIG